MALIDFLEKLKRIDQLIRMQATGTPDEFAKKLGVAKSTLYSYVNTMKHYNAPICYNDERKTFCYLEEGKFQICFTHKKLSDKELNKIIGGRNPKEFSIFCLSSVISN